MALSKVDVECGGTGLVAAGTSGNVLTSDGTDWTSAAAAGGGAWNLIATSVANNSASLTITGLNSDYDTYAFVIADIRFSSDDTRFNMRCGNGSIDSSGYSYGRGYNGTFLNGTANNTFLWIADSCGNGPGEGGNLMGYLHRPSDGLTYPTFSWMGGSMNKDDNYEHWWGGGQRDAVMAIDRIQIYAQSGNLASGRFSIYGISHA